MSAHQGNSACRITVDCPVADVWREEAKKVLMFNHEPFEDYLDYVPAKQLALADIFRDATAVIDALGWDPEAIAEQDGGFEVPLTFRHIQQLHHRRTDLLDTNLDLLTDIGADNDVNALIMADIHANRRGVEALNHILDAYGETVAT
jgi:cytolysin (calcineurin-like family phosphatase)